MNDEELSKLLSHALRHEPWLYELELDSEGWVPLSAVIEMLREQREEWRELTRLDLERMIETSAKRRHEIAGARIRAIYGHSVPGKLSYARALPPAILFHGTSPAAAITIAVEGLKPMSRQYVHLSIDRVTALEVGRRKARAPVLLEIDARAASDSGVAFYTGNEQVWLADAVPARFVRAVA